MKYYISNSGEGWKKSAAVAVPSRAPALYYAEKERNLSLLAIDVEGVIQAEGAKMGIHHKKVQTFLQRPQSRPFARWEITTKTNLLKKMGAKSDENLYKERHRLWGSFSITEKHAFLQEHEDTKI